MRKIIFIASILTASSLPAVAGNVTYTPGAIIIPTSASYQDQCGTVSAFGLVYQTLRANDWLEGNGFGRIEIHFGFKSVKGSPNRCVPTNLHSPPAPSGDTAWNDGCDFSLVDATKAPVKLVVNATASNTATDTNVVTFNTVGRADVFPQYGSITVQNTGVAGTTVNTVGYLGAPFVISAADAPTFSKLLDGTLIAQDPNLVNIDFSQFRSNSGSCTFGTTHYVRMHRVQSSFTAELNRVFTATPPRAALLGTGSGVSNGILQVYLQNAGLGYVGANGCPPGGKNIASAALCPTGGNPGQIFDLFDVQDLANNLHMLDDSNGRPLYRAVWTPHWDQSGTALETSARTNLSQFLEQQRGLLGECASIQTYEGATVASSALTQFQSCVNNGTGGCSTSTTTQGFEKNTAAAPSGNLKNCTDPTAVSGSPCMYYAFPADPFSQTADYVWATDNGTVSDWLPRTSTNSIYKPGVVPLMSSVAVLDKTKLATLAQARTMVAADLSTRVVKDNTPGKGNVSYLGGHDLTGGVAGTMVVLETLLQLDQNQLTLPSTTIEVSRSSPIVASINGQPALVQGTFDNVTPAPSRKEINVNSDTSFFVFPHIRGHLRAFPTSNITTTGQTFDTTALAPIFDAGDKDDGAGNLTNGIPPVNFAGCGNLDVTGNVSIISNCRTIFTTTAASCGPSPLAACAPTMFDTSGPSVSTLGTLLASNITPANQTTLIKRILAGVSNGFGGFVPKLGGVDRSTVAVIGESTLAGTSRPTIAYFGATDGMLHAVCASSGLGCTLGRELWAYIPRTNLPNLRYNTAKVEGSPHVIDAFVDDGTGKRSFKTILTFQTGTGAAGAPGATPAVYAIDVTNPLEPKVMWENTTPTVRGAHELGQGLALASGKVLVSSQIKNVLFVQTNNGGTAGSADVVTALDLENGSSAVPPIWQKGYTYQVPPRGIAADGNVPVSAIPGGAVAIDKNGSGLITDLVFGDIFGRLWEVDPADGTSRYGAGVGPLFSFTTNFHAIGVRPAILKKGNIQYAIFVSGGYVDTSSAPTIWGSGVVQSAIAVSLDAAGAVDENGTSPDIGFKFDIGTGEKGFAQALVVGNEVFFTTDTVDVNASGYGTSGTTGKLYKFDFDAANTAGTVIAVQPPNLAGGANTLANSGAEVFSASANQTQRAPTDAASATGTSVDPTQVPKVTRKLWLRTQ